MSERNIPLHESPYPGVLRPETVEVSKEDLLSQIDALTKQVAALSAEVKLLREGKTEPKKEASVEDDTPTAPLPPRVAKEPKVVSEENKHDGRKRIIRTALGALAIVGAVFAGNALLFNKTKSVSASTNTQVGNTVTGSTTAKEKLGPVAPIAKKLTAQEERLAPLADKSVDTIEEATKAYDGKNFDMATQDILGNPDAFKNVDINHFYNRYINAEGFDDKMSTQNAFEAKLIGIAQDKANAQSAANLIEKKAKDGARTDSHAEQIELIRKFLLDKDTKVDGDYRLNGHWGNGLVDKDGKLSTHVRVFNNHRAVRITGANGAEWIFTLDSINEVKEGNCFNDVVDVPEPKKTTPKTDPQPKPDPKPQPKPDPKPDPKPRPQPKPTPEVCPIPGLGNLPKDDPNCKKKEVPAKDDPNTTPGGVPGQNGGSGTTTEPGPTGPGTGPSGQPVSPVGTVGGEVLPPAPTPAPTPAPVPAPPAPPVTPGEVHPDPTPPTTPATPATGSETPAPTTPVNGDAGPQG